jgi:signal transduction histidine kinase/CheY-like chemotaxis protein
VVVGEYYAKSLLFTVCAGHRFFWLFWLTSLLLVFPNPMNQSTATAPPTGDAPLLAQHLDLMLQQSKTVFGGNFIMAGMSVLALWNFADHRTLLGWSALIFAITGLRIVFVASCRRAGPPPAQATQWAWRFAATSLISGIAWGSMAVLFFDASQPLSVLFVCWALAGMTTAAVPTLSNFLPAYVGFAVPAILPYAILCFREGGTMFTTLGLLTFYFLGANLTYARTSNRTTGESIQLRFENLALMAQLRIQKERAESASATKSRFLAAASHDLRQPTHALGLFVGALERLMQRDRSGGSASTFGPVVSRMRTTLLGMGNLLNALLDTSRLEAGAVPVELTTFRVQDLFDRTYNEFHGAAAGKGLQLHLRPTDLLVTSDALLLGRMLSNLTANAVKYTSHGRILVGCRRRSGTVEIQVHDTGIGIPAQHHASIFDEFVQLDNTARNRELGLGLGLSIVSRAAQLLEHPVRLRSIPGRGSMFSIAVPRARELPASELRATAASGHLEQTGTVIVIDDDASAREAIGDLLDAHGYQVIAGASIGQLRERLEGRHTEAVMIVADYRLGHDVTGVDAIRAIQPLLARPAPAIIVTGDTSPDRIRDAQASGYLVLHKPLEANVLLRALQSGT